MADRLSIADFLESGGATPTTVEQPTTTETVGQEQPVPTSSVSISDFLENSSATPMIEDVVEDTSAPEPSQTELAFEDDPKYVDFYVKNQLPVPDSAVPSDITEQPERKSRVEKLSDREEYTDEQYQMIADGMDDIIAQERVSMRGLDPVSGLLLKAAGEGGATGAKTLLGFANIFENIGAYTGDAIEDFLGKAKEQTVGRYIYDAIDSAVAGSRYGKAKNERDLANKIMDIAVTGLEFSETIPALGSVMTSANVLKRTAGDTIDSAVKASTKEAKALETARRNSYKSAELATMESMQETRDLAAKVAQENKDIAERLIVEFEETTGKVISTEVGGRKVLDFDLAREAGKETAVDAMGDDIAPIFRDLAVGDELIVQPILKPEKFDGIVAIASEFKKRNPDAWNNKKSVIDNLFELTVNKELDGQALVDDLNRYGLSFEDYVLTVVGSGSEAGRVLNKLSQIKRARPISEKAELDQRKLVSQQGVIRKNVMRLENIRRGLLVSQIATAARNLTSGGIRAPLEGLGNVMDTALMKGAGQLVSGQNWRDSFAHMSYMFSRPDVAKGYTDLILKQPELTKQFDAMYNNINEIQKLTGRGEATAIDKKTGKRTVSGALDGVLSTLEDGTTLLNAPNRWQEYLIRRGQFFGELQRQVRNEYDADLIDLLQQGKLRDLLNDASTVKPEGKRSFLDLVDASVRKSLDVTYAKQPEIPVFRSASQFIVRNGLTVAMPFPRFMFNSMELMGQYAGGASIPLTRKIAGIVDKTKRGPLTEKDRQRISRNMLGIAAVGAAYMYRTSDDAPAEYNQVSISDETQMDTTPQYPLPQFLYVGEATKRMMDGTFDDWFTAREFVELFAGTNLRTGVGNSVFEELAQMADATDLTKGESVGRLLGRTLGNYLSTWAVPFGQIIEAERAAGARGVEYKDMASDPTFDMQGTFMRELQRPFKQRGIGVSAAEEEAAPSREFLFAESKERVSPLSRLFLGLNLSTKDAEYGEYLRKLGFQDYLLGSRSKVASIKRFENALLRDYVPTVVEVAQRREKRLREIYKDKPASLKEQFTEEEFVNNNIKPFITENINKIKRKVSEGSVSVGDDYTRAMVAYRRLTPSYRKQATTDFVDRYGRMPDPMSTKDLQRLKAIGDAYSKAYR